MKPYKRNFLQRIFGIPFTGLIDDQAWTFDRGIVKVALDRVPALREKGGSIRIESEDPQIRILVIHGDDGMYHAYENRCGHGGRRIDHVHGKATLMCCSMGKSSYDYAGGIIGGPAEKPLKVYPVENEDGVLVISF